MTEVTRPAKSVTIADVAARSGVSPAAVSRVFNGRGGISVATEARIKKVADEMGWTPSSAAVALRNSKTMAVGLILNTDITGPDVLPMPPPVLLGIEQVIAQRGYGLLLHVFSNDAEEELHAYKRLAADKRVDGVLMTGARVEDTRFRLLKELGMPAVLIGPTPSGVTFPHVENDPPGAGMDECVHHLFALGHRRIAYIGGPLSRVQPKIRAEAFLKAMASVNLTPVMTVSTDYTTDAAVSATRQAMMRMETPTAFIYGSDLMAMAGMHCLREGGIEVPHDISVMGFDDQKVAQYMNPGLTTVARNSSQRGEHAAMKLLRILGLDLPEPGPLDAPRLIIRGSTGPMTGI